MSERALLTNLSAVALTRADLHPHRSRRARCLPLPLVASRHLHFTRRVCDTRGATYLTTTTGPSALLTPDVLLIGQGSGRVWLHTSRGKYEQKDINQRLTGR